MRIADLPADARGVTWFWGLMRPGESGLDLANRVERVPEDLDLDEIFRWTKVTSGPRGVVLLAARYKGKPRVFSFKPEE